MKLATVLPWWLVLGVVGPAQSAPSVGLAWPDQATATPRVRQRMAAEIARSLDIPAAAVVPDAVDRARRIAAHEVARASVVALEAWAERLAAAGRRYREGELLEARAEAEAVLAGARSLAEVPGAVRVAYASRLLLAQIAWTHGETDQARVHLAAAAALDPQATLSTRRVPPAVASLYAHEKQRIEEDKAAWEPINIAAPSPTRLEIDGRPGARRVPVAEHFVVVRRAGAAPTGAVVGGGGAWRPPNGEVEIPEGLPATRADADRVCERLQLRSLVLVDRRSPRLALQAYACGEGYGSAWYGTTATLAQGVAVVFAADAKFTGQRAAVRSDRPLPAATRPRRAAEATDAPQPTRKAWYRRAWVWVVLGSVVVTGVTLGAVLGTREPPARIVVDPDAWLTRER